MTINKMWKPGFTCHNGRPIFKRKRLFNFILTLYNIGDIIDAVDVSLIMTL